MPTSRWVRAVTTVGIVVVDGGRVLRQEGFRSTHGVARCQPQCCQRHADPVQVGVPRAGGR